MMFIYHVGTGTYMDGDDAVYVIDSADMTSSEMIALAEGLETQVFEFVIDAGRATRFPDIFGDKS